MSASILLLDFRWRVLDSSVDGDFGSQLARQSHFLRTQVDGRDVQAHGLGILDGDVAEASGTGDHNPLARPGVGFF